MFHPVDNGKQPTERPPTGGFETLRLGPGSKNCGPCKPGKFPQNHLQIAILLAAFLRNQSGSFGHSWVNDCKFLATSNMSLVQKVKIFQCRHQFPVPCLTDSWRFREYPADMFHLFFTWKKYRVPNH